MNQLKATMCQLTVASILGISLISNARELTEINKPVYCSTTKIIMESLYKDYNEQPMWNGVGEYSKFVLMVNPKTKDWSLVEFDDTTACIIGVGKESNLIFKGLIS